MALDKISGSAITWGLATVGALGIGTAVQATADTAIAPTRPMLSAGLKPACGPGAMLNIAQAALGAPRLAGPTTPEAAVAEFAALVGVALPRGPERTRQLSVHEAIVHGPASVGHVVQHGNHWQADYLAVCLPAAVPDVSTLPVPSVPAPSPTNIPATSTPETPSGGPPPLATPSLPGTIGLGHR